MSQSIKAIFARAEKRLCRLSAGGRLVMLILVALPTITNIHIGWNANLGLHAGLVLAARILTFPLVLVTAVVVYVLRDRVTFK